MAINARDDPFIDENSLPSDKDLVIDNEGGEGSEEKLLAPVKLIYTKNGGHCGFVSSFFADTKPHGWLSEELANALLHIHENQQDDDNKL